MLYQTIRIVYNLLFLIQCYTSDYVHVKEVLDYLFKGCIVHCKIYTVYPQDYILMDLQGVI